MGLIEIKIAAGATPEVENSSPHIYGGDVTFVQMSAAGAISITFGSTVKVVTYTATGPATIPTELEIYNAWKPVIGAANGAAGPAFSAPQFQNSAGVNIYPTIS